MTFLEAAIEILRHEKDGLPIPDIARHAVARNLLSHVGRDPEGAMRVCLDTAARNSGPDALIVRTSPGVFAIRPGATLPDSPVPRQVNGSIRQPALDSSEPEDTESPAKLHTRPHGGERRGRGSHGSGATRSAQVRDESPRRTVARKHNDASSSRRGASSGEGNASDDGGHKKRRRKTRGASRSESAPIVEVVSSRRNVREAPSEQEPESDTSQLEFEAPVGSGLTGVTDVAVVMANALSRIAHDRPELREELEAMQQQTIQSTSPMPSQKSSADVREDIVVEERVSRRRRRRRRRGRRVEWSDGAGDARVASQAMADTLLDNVARILHEAGGRSLHIRQIAETLAGIGVLGGEISEIERAVTSAILLDHHTYARASRFVARGDARYQLQSARLPPGAAQAEQALGDALRSLERETGVALEHWLQSLGARALESVVRIYLQREGHSLVATLPPGRGLSRLVVEDPDDDDDARMLVVVIPKRIVPEVNLWEGDAERNQCRSVMLFVMGELPDDSALGDVRIVSAAELARWMLQHSIGTGRMDVGVAVLDPTFLESIGGLDT